MSPRRPSVASLPKRHSGSKSKVTKTVKHPKELSIESSTQSSLHELVKRVSKRRVIVVEAVEAIDTQSWLLSQSSPKRASSSMDDPSSRSIGSHTLKSGVFTRCKSLTLGNISDVQIQELTPKLSGHVYRDFVAHDNGNVHIGNTGPDGEGHKIINPSIEGAVTANVGDFSNMEVKFEYFRLANQSTRE